MKLLLLLLLAILFIGCDGPSAEEIKARQAFINKYGATNVYVCNEAGFLENRSVNQDGSEDRWLLKNDSSTPVRCTGNVSVQVKETVCNGLLSGSTN